MFLVFAGLDAVAGQDAALPTSSAAALPPGFSGPAPPVPPATINRDAAGRATLRAVRLATPLRIDGRLDEEVYASVPAMSDFIQNDPKEGAPATEKTDVWIFYDRDNVYVVARCWETHPERIIANEMRHDSLSILQNDLFGFGFDTFYDRRNPIIFDISVAGGFIDGAVTNERAVNTDWNPIWKVKTGRFEGGWALEAALPFKSIRYKTAASQVWGFQARRVNKWKNEVSFLTPIPASVGAAGHFRASLAATLVGIEAPTGSKNLEIKPYVTSNVTTDTTARPAIRNDPGGDVGVDVKYGVTQSLTADFTYNTDFAQVEADEQQVNLTRFNLFFPEKREFFLENSGTFTFGGSTRASNPRPAAAASNSSFSSQTDIPILFYSRQIGLAEGREVPVQGGARLTGRVGRFTIGLLDVQAGDQPATRTRATNFSVLRVKRDILRSSSVGVMFTGRSLTPRGVGGNQAYGVDGSFSFKADLVVNTYWARTHTEGAFGDGTSYRAQFDYTGDRYGLQAEHLLVDPRFDPQVGFVQRRDMRKNYAQFRFSPRTKASKRVRRYSLTGSFKNIDNTTGRLETRTTDAQFESQFHNSDRFFFGYSDNREFLPVPFGIATGVTLPVGAYGFGSGRVGYSFGRQRTLSGDLSVDRGTFYSGHKTTYSASPARVNIGSQTSIEPSVSVNRIDLAQGSFTTTILGTRASFTMTPLMFVSAFLQYNSGSNTVATNVRFRWEYQPGSELFLVYNEQRDTLTPSFPGLTNRAFIVKFNRLFRF